MKTVQPAHIGGCNGHLSCVYSCSFCLSSAHFHFPRPLQRCSFPIHHTLLSFNPRSCHSHLPCNHLIPPHLSLLSISPFVFCNLDPEPCILIPESVLNLCMIYFQTSDFLPAPLDLIPSLDRLSGF